MSIRTGGHKQGINSTETFNAGIAELKARQANKNPSSFGQEPPLSPTSQNGAFTSNMILFHDAGTKESRNHKGRTVHTSDLSHRVGLNSGASGIRELRNSRSTAASGQRKEVFSKTRIVNDKGIAMTQAHHFKAGNALSSVSSKGFVDALGNHNPTQTELYLEEARLNTRQTHHSRKQRTSTARTMNQPTRAAESDAIM